MIDIITTETGQKTTFQTVGGVYSLILMAENTQVNGNMAGRMVKVNLIT